MIPYRFYPLTCERRIAGPPVEIELKDDATAIALALGLFKDAVAVEVWNGARKVGRVTAEEARAAVPAGIEKASDSPPSSPYSTTTDQRNASPALRLGPR